MSTATPPSDQAPKPAAKPKPLVPPDERFWKHYSPHHEFSLSSVGSFTLHGLVIGLLILMAIGVIRFGGSKPVPVETVSLDLGGGGGSRTGVGDGSGVGTGAEPKEDKGNTQTPMTGTTEPEKPPELDAGKAAETKVNFDEELVRYVKAGDEAKSAFTRLDQEVQKKLRDGLTAGKGRGGAGSGGGKDGGKGTGEGDGQGPGTRKTSLTQREKRMLRWSMTFDTRNGTDYVNQLAGLGAILAIPTGPENPPAGYYVIRNLRNRPIDLKEEDVGKIQCIFWVDDRPESVRSMLNALGLQRLNVSHFVAFMPPNVEQRLYNIERDYRNRKEDDIYETKFKVRVRGGMYEPYVVEQTPKR